MTDPDKLIDKALEKKYFPGIAVEVEEKGKPIYRRISGLASELNGREALQEQSIFDLASLSKCLATAPVLLHLLASEGISTQEKLGRFLPDSQQGELTLHNLLLHISGLPPLPDMFKLFPSGNLSRKEKAVSHLYTVKADRPQGQDMIYSCTGYILLGLVAESIGQDSLDHLFKRIILDPGALADLLYNPGSDKKDLCVTEEFDPWRNCWLKGEVHDENAWTMQGVSGNAGLFGTLDSVSSLMELFRSKGILNSRRILREEDVFLMTNRGNPLSSGLPRAYGFGCYDPDFFSGPGFSNKAYGHTGFTGTSVWIDPERDLKIVILTNRVHYGRDNTAAGIKEFRCNFHSLFL